MTLDLDALEATARAATQQERWKVTDLRNVPDGGRDCIWIDTDSTTTYATIAEMNDEDGLFPLWGIEDARHIAAFDPPTVLALIARLREAEATIDAVESLCEQTDTETDEAIQAWLVDNIGAAISRYKTTKTEGDER